MELPFGWHGCLSVRISSSSPSHFDYDTMRNVLPYFIVHRVKLSRLIEFSSSLDASETSSSSNKNPFDTYQFH